MQKIFIIFFLLVPLLAGCKSVIEPITNVANEIDKTAANEEQKTGDKATAIVKCEDLCQRQLTSDGVNFEVGPCLSNAIVPDWACDVAHSPRQAVDNDPKNQCLSFREGKVSHFVEVDGNCNLIKAL